MRRWEEVIEHQAELWRWWDTDRGKRFASNFATSVAIKNLTKSDVHDNLVMIERTRLLTAEPFYVSNDIMDIWDYAAPSFKPEPLLPSDLITGAGFVYLPRPIYITDVHEKKTGVRAFLWSPVKEQGTRGKNGVLLSLYSSSQDKDDYWTELPEDPPGELLLSHVTPWWFGDEYPWNEPGMLKNYERGIYDVEKGLAALFSTVQPIQSFWRLSQQTLSQPGRYEAGRASRRRARRIKEEMDRYITVIQLRRPKGAGHADGTGSGVEYSHRWIVGGYWRNQLYKSEDVYRQIYIAPHVKGPKDKPLILRKQRVFEFVK